ncbi:SICAvar, type I (fragment), partial [Plasmodium knowlesi strain H]
VSSSSSISSSGSPSSSSGGGGGGAGTAAAAPAAAAASSSSSQPVSPTNAQAPSEVDTAPSGLSVWSRILGRVQKNFWSMLTPTTWITKVPVAAINTASSVAPSVITKFHEVVGGKLQIDAPTPAALPPPPEPVPPTPTTKPTKPWDRLTPFIALAPATVAISIFSYLIWKYFAQLRKIRLYRRAPLRIPGPSVQEQLLDHVEEAGPHEYQLVKERKPRSAPTRTKRSGRDPAGGGRVNRRTIIKIHFELVDECQKGNTKLTQNDFLELLVREFMGSEFMEEEEEEQVSKEEVLMEGVPMESVPMEGVPMELVPSLGSGLLV